MTIRGFQQSRRSFPKGNTVRIRRLYRQRTQRRDHAMNAVIRDFIEQLYNEGVSTVFVGNLTDVLETHWSVRANAKTLNFGRFGRSSTVLPVFARSTVSCSKRGRKHEPYKSAPTVGSERQLCATKIHRRVRVASTGTRILQRLRRS